MSAARTRVAITGLGLVTPLGTGVEQTWKSLLAGHSGAGPLTKFDIDGFPVRIAAEATDFEPKDFMDARDARRSDRFCQMAVAAAVMSVDNAGWGGALPYEASRIGVVVGSGIGGLTTLEAQHDVLRERGASKISPFAVPLLMVNGAAGAISMRYGITGPSFAPVSACATGAHAIGEAARLIRSGACDAALAGGSESAMTPLALGAFATMGAVSKRNDEPERASRPFDAQRDGFVMGEGGGVLVLEDWEQAERRGATIVGELIGYGASSDAYHLTAPDPEGAGAALAMRLAMKDADLEPSQVGYINAHGTSTPFNDKIETMAIKRVFGERPPPVSSTKSSTGHLIGAAGAVEAAFGLLAIRDGMLPPTINYENPDPECDLDYIPNTARAAAIDTMISNSFGFGGHNACLAFKKAS